jgi:MoxR-like ATPase
VLDRIRDDPRVVFGASPRSGLLLLRAAKALAALEGRDHVLPDDVQELVPAVLAHRLLLAPTAAGVERAAILADALEEAPAL